MTDEEKSEALEVVDEIEDENDETSPMDEVYEDDVEGDGDGDDDEDIDFSKIETLLNPASSQIQKQIENYVIKNPRLLSELLSVKFSDLVSVFKSILSEVRANGGTAKEAYIQLFELLDSKGSEGVTAMAPDQRDETDEVIERVLEKYVSNVGQDEDSLIQQRRDQIRVAALLDLMNIKVKENDDADEHDEL